MIELTKPKYRYEFLIVFKCENPKHPAHCMVADVQSTLPTPRQACAEFVEAFKVDQPTDADAIVAIHHIQMVGITPKVELMFSPMN